MTKIKLLCVIVKINVVNPTLCLNKQKTITPTNFISNFTNCCLYIVEKVPFHCHDIPCFMYKTEEAISKGTCLLKKLP